jgi:flagellar protein FliS
LTTEEILNQQKKTAVDDDENSAVVAYKRNDLHIDSKVKLVEALYEGILKFNTNIAKAITDGDVEQKTHWINRTNSIFVELVNALDMKAEGTTAEYLNGLYNHQITLLFEVNRDDDLEKLESINRVVKGLLEAWREDSGIDSKEK